MLLYKYYLFMYECESWDSRPCSLNLTIASLTFDNTLTRNFLHFYIYKLWRLGKSVNVKILIQAIGNFFLFLLQLTSWQPYQAIAIT